MLLIDGALDGGVVVVGTIVLQNQNTRQPADTKIAWFCASR